ncbi:MAG: multifunctional oxoglutarate decarboxylase/oxoglutarate dehydrogenase thiamine pyrophosphate-binding subunit/dihydrolipoyllysine-residue succinyltransferase subunit, partial [Candidatus Nephthysia bennettiae]
MNTDTVQVVMPAMGDSVTEGTVLEWHKQQGDTVEADETLVEISTDKVDADVPAPVTGTVVRIHVGEGATVPVGELLAEIATEGAAPDTMSETAGEGDVAPGTPAAEAAAESEADQVRAQGNGASSATRADGAYEAAAGAPSPATETAKAPYQLPPEPELPDDAHVSPVARRAAAVEGVDLTRVPGSGPGGRVTKADVLAASGNGAAAAMAPRAPEPLAAGAQVIKGAAAMLAHVMDESRSIPTATSFRTLTVTMMDARRRELKAAGEHISFTHLMAYAIARVATRDMPVMAHHFEDRDGTPHRVDDGAVNLGIAVDVEKRDGTRTLMVPVIRDAGRRSFADFRGAFDELIAKARDNRLIADDLVGANLTLTNPGGLGTVASVPRLMTGQGTIVATGSIGYPAGLGHIGDMIGAEKVMTTTSTYDHRIIQGA